ncbi:related to YPT7-GTP-binding protein of the RAB family [Ustilago bromivora]|uniref:Related to YPT7 - GTP-binding protein of the RAB family n=1 Tax=Ustilago bromivora TaxID=307758 RepID=A0A1K0G9Q4_9BASI|nr:related to YPT7-GTP-binding protein of the RAB family [Ustilago bromivora]SYW77936.1 related to YPT7 - GTP-binding protein of the RAB family [Ustilago bromivora]
MPIKTTTILPNRRDGPSTSTTPRRKPQTPILSRLPTSEAASILQSSAVATIGSIRTLASISSAATSLHALPTPRRAIKVVLIGDGGTGKTSLRNRFLTNTFYPSYRATIGADFITKSLPLDPLNPEGEKATLQIWDTAGQERFQSLGSAFYRGADAVVIAIDASKGLEGVKKVKGWYEAFMQKGPGPEEEGDRRRFCWICVANKSDLLEDVDGGMGLQRAVVRGALDGLVTRREGQVDWGIDPGQMGERASGNEEPADPSEVLSRPNPYAMPPEEEGTPMKPSTSINGITSPTPARKNSSKDYKLSRKSLSSIAAAAKKNSDTQANGNGTVNTMYVTPCNTISNLPQLSSSPTAKSDLNISKQDGATGSTASSSNAGGGTSSGFLPSWRRSKASSSSLQPGAGKKGHAKRQQIKSIEVFHLSDHESSSETEAGGDRKFAFPSSAARTPPPKSLKSSIGGKGGEREREDSTMSLGAPSVYHTPRSSTILSSSPTPRTTLGLPSASGRDDGSLRHGKNQSGASSLRVDGLPPSSSSALSPSEEGRESEKGLKHKPCLASSSAGSVATLKPPPLIAHRSSSTQHPALRAPKSINDLFQPEPQSQTQSSPRSPPLPSPDPPGTPSTISLPPAPLPPPINPNTAEVGEIEEGFTLFYTSAKTGHNVDRLFSHIVHRVTTLQAYEDAARRTAEDQGEREEREGREQELMRRTIRLASGKNPDRGWLGCC